MQEQIAMFGRDTGEDAIIINRSESLRYILEYRN